MAPGSEENLSCPVCHDIFKDPVVLTCSHSFCSDCLQSWWRQKHSRECPVCKAVSSRKKPPVSLVLKNLCEAFVLERDQRASEDVCSLHSEKLKLFCLDHQQPVCLVCRDSENHADHKFRPVDEAARELRKEFEDALFFLTYERLDSIKAEYNFDAAADHIKVQARRVERQIKEHFKKLHQFLKEEEEARLAALREEEEQKSRVMKEMLESVIRDLPRLADSINATQAQMKAGDVTFLLNYKATMEKIERHSMEGPYLPEGALIDEVKHLGNLTYNIWDKMKDVVSYCPVILDPNTAGLAEIVCADLCTFVEDDEDNPYTSPDNPERITNQYAALGSEGFTSGTHSWDVEIGDCKYWDVGVVEKSLFEVKESEPTGLWCIGFHPDGGYSICSPSAEHRPALRVKKKPQRIRVILDFITGTLSFSHADTNRRIHTFRHAFDDTMVPYFRVCGSLKILPVKCDTTTC